MAVQVYWKPFGTQVVLPDTFTVIKISGLNLAPWRHNDVTKWPKMGHCKTVPILRAHISTTNHFQMFILGRWVVLELIFFHSGCGLLKCYCDVTMTSQKQTKEKFLVSIVTSSVQVLTSNLAHWKVLAISTFRESLIEIKQLMTSQWRHKDWPKIGYQKQVPTLKIFNSATDYTLDLIIDRWVHKGLIFVHTKFQWLCCLDDVTMTSQKRTKTCFNGFS